MATLALEGESLVVMEKDVVEKDVVETEEVVVEGQISGTSRNSGINLSTHAVVGGETSSGDDQRQALLFASTTARQSTITGRTPPSTSSTTTTTTSTPPPPPPPPPPPSRSVQPTPTTPTPLLISIPDAPLLNTNSNNPNPNPNNQPPQRPQRPPTPERQHPPSHSSNRPPNSRQTSPTSESSNRNHHHRHRSVTTSTTGTPPPAPTTASQAARKNVPHPAPPPTHSLSAHPASTTSTPAGSTTATAATKPRKERPCDACRRRKSRCVLNEGASKCVLCQFHSQECTFVQSPQPRKRRLQHTTPTNSTTTNSTSTNQTSSDTRNRERKRPTTEPNSPKSTSSNEHAYKIRDTIPVTDYSSLANSALRETLGLQGNRHSHLIGPTAEYEGVLIDLCPFDAKDEYGLAQGGSFRRIDRDTAFLLYPDPKEESYELLDAIESVVAPHGEKLVKLYFRIIHPSFPILHQRVWFEKYSRSHREFSPPLLAAVYILALHWWGFDRELAGAKKPDVAKLEKLAEKAMQDVVRSPKLGAVQAGLLLLQRNEEVKGSAWALTAQLVAVGQELGLHLDCTTWKIPRWEKGLRKRLAWGLYMQDKWGALTQGRPSHITRANWAVRPLEHEDFPDSVDGKDRTEENEDGCQEVEKGRLLFGQMVALTGILADVLDTFFTVEAQSAMDGRGATQQVLERAKPIQIRLKEWFMKLPECLRMDATNKNRRLSSTGYLHLAYFSTEITLHRQILRTLNPSTHLDPYLLYICRSAAKTRLISAMDFVNRLKPEQLQSFWYFASKLNFALIATFGSLLWATSPTWEEAEFYKARLSEYRWTLRVSSRGADFMEFAVSVLDSSAGACQQEQFRRKGLLKDTPPVTVGHSKFGLGMGVGLGLDVQPPPRPNHSSSSSSNTKMSGMMRERGQLSPVTSDPGEGDEEEEDEMDEEDDGDVDADGDEEMEFARSPTSGSEDEADFFMIPEREE